MRTAEKHGSIGISRVLLFWADSPAACLCSTCLHSVCLTHGVLQFGPRGTYERIGLQRTRSGIFRNPARDAPAVGRFVDRPHRFGNGLSPLLGDDQPTVITQRGMLPADSRSDSVVRILHGRILPGERLGHFELLQYVGGGGMGKVFRALDTRLARSVALKILSPEHAADRETVLRFQNEAQSAARLDHDNIARVYYVGEDRGLHYIVFEFIEGVNVRDLVESKGPLPLAEAVSYTLQVADALAHAAERNVVHRDIKPSNLLITPAGQAKLIDMGLARLREVDAAAADLTASGVTLGTFDYISPEQARDPRNTDVRSDIYSLGCTFFFMLTGRPPFLGGTMLQKLLQHQADQPPDLRQFRPELPEDVNRILRKMLAKDPRRRYSSPMELVNDLLWVARCGRLAAGGAWRADLDGSDRGGCSFLLSASAVDRFPAGLGGDCRRLGLSLALLAGARQSVARARGDRNGRWGAQCAASRAACGQLRSSLALCERGDAGHHAWG